MRLAICQINTTVGDLDGNLARIRGAADAAVSQGAQLALFPELTLTGYPPEDLLLRPRFLRACREAILEPAVDLPLPCLVGLPHKEQDAAPLCNAAMLIAGGEVRAIYRKVLLPNYAVFDEKRYFAPGAEGVVFECAGLRCGVVICEDAWDLAGPALDEAAAGADVILNLSASPFHRGKHAERLAVFGELCRRCRTPMAWCNLVGGQDELVFDGGSMLIGADGALAAMGPEFEEAVFCIDLEPRERGGGPAPPPPETARPVRVVENTLPVKDRNGSVEARPIRPAHEKLDDLDEIHACLVLGVGDYVRKNGFEKVVIGLSGGIDSALTAAVAVDALGAQNVVGVTMPSRYSSAETRSDAEKLAESLGIRLETIPIEDLFHGFETALMPVFAGAEADVTEENLQARIRAVLLMALANKFGWLVLNTSNKSEAAVGYGTMYGDMIGGYAALKDVFKTTVFALSRRCNERAGRELIPASTIARPPTAELKPDQKDEDSLPAYERLDPVLTAYIEGDQSSDELVAAGFDPEVVRTAIRMTDAAEWKRRQSVPGVRVTPKAFGKDRRLPLTNRYRP